MSTLILPPASNSKIFCTVRTNVPVVTANNTVTPIPFELEVHDPDNMHDLAVDTQNVVIPEGYNFARAVGYGQWTNNNTSYRVLTIHLNNQAAMDGAQAYDARPSSASITGTNPQNVITPVFPVVGGDILDFRCRQLSGGALNFLQAWFSVECWK